MAGKYYICTTEFKKIFIMKESIMSFFNAPISNKVPAGVCNVRGLHAYITANPRLEELTRRVRGTVADKDSYRRTKLALLPYVTPAGVFSYCKERCITLPSGLFVIDFDHLGSPREAATWRDRLFDDTTLRPDLAFVSPGGDGVKLFVPYRLHPAESLKQTFAEVLHTAWQYLEWQHGLKADTANADLSRACLLAHDGEAKKRGL